jgi:hypothetical protein
MTRLFDSEKLAGSAEHTRDQEDVRKRAMEVDKLLAEHEDLDEESARLGAQLDESYAVQPVRYRRYRRPGCRWLIEHARVGDDYVYQLFPLRETKLGWQDVVALLITAMDVIFPRSIMIVYQPPKLEYEIKYYTIRVQKVAKLPGWESAATERALDSLSRVEAW